MIESIVNVGIQAALAVLVLAMIPNGIRVFIGPSAADRLQAVDSLTTLLVGSIVVLALAQNAEIFVDVGIAIAAFSFVATLAIARYLSEGKPF